MTSVQTKSLRLRSKHPEKCWSAAEYTGYCCWNLALALVAIIILGVSCLLLSYSNFDADIFAGYFAHPAIVFINVLLPATLFACLYTVIGRLWLSYAVTALVCLGICIGNYYLIIIRCDPLLPQDITCLREALSISASQHYDLAIGWRIILSVLACALACVLLALCARATLRVRGRLVLLAVSVVAIAASFLCTVSNDIYSVAMDNDSTVNTWSSTQIYVSKGALYSFVREALTVSGKKPDDYNKQQTEELMAQYTDETLTDAQKVNVLVVMRESYSDLSDCGGSDGVDWQTPYAAYHALAEESYTGRMVSNGFGGNTKDAERCFLTGSVNVPDYRSTANSYLWYLREQGYRVEGAHPFNGWFYNRQNFNAYIGFEDYYFAENKFNALVGEDETADDDVLYQTILELFGEADETQPYFSYSVTFEGHGPYDYHGSKRQAFSFVTDGAGTADGYALNDYLNCIYTRDKELTVLVDALRESERPVVLLVYGDHNATLGADVNNYTTAAYERYGINMDVSTPDGFLNHYSTEYLIWANGAAKKLLDFSFTGEGPTVSPCYLMNVLADTLGWTGSAHMQLMHRFQDALPVVSDKGVYLVDGELVQELDFEHADVKHQLDCVNYYWQHEFLYEDLK